MLLHPIINQPQALGTGAKNTPRVGLGPAGQLAGLGLEPESDRTTTTRPIFATPAPRCESSRAVTTSSFMRNALPRCLPQRAKPCR